MSFFKEVEGEAAIIVAGGVYKQVPLYTRDGYIYAKDGAGFIRLMADAATTKPKTRLDFMTWTGQLYRDPLGRLCTNEVPRRIALEPDKARQLLGSDAS